MAKELEIILTENEPTIAVTMRAVNVGDQPKRFALWGLTVCAQSGPEIIPMNTDDTKLLSNRTIEVWPYTDLSDKRVKWFNRYVTLAQDPAATKPFKLGFDLKEGTVHYLLNGEVFTKSFPTYHPAVYPDHNCSFETYTNNNFIEIESLGELINRAKADGLLHTEREDVLLFETVNPGEVIVNTTRIVKLNPVDPWDLSKAEREGRKQAHELIKFFRESCAGFENAILVSTGVQIGVRESRRVMGDYVLTQEDLLKSKYFEDTVALGGYPIDIHNPTGAKTETTHLKPGQYYYIPLRSLIVKGFENLLVCGRCMSATHEAGAAIRVTPIAMGVGQAAGAAAGLAASKSVPVKNLEIVQIHDALLKLRATIL